MKPSTPSRWAVGILLALPLLPLCGFLLNASPERVFFIGTAVFIIDVLVPVWLLAAGNTPPPGSPAVVKPIRFTIRDLLCLTMFLFGITVFIFSAFKCAAAEEASRPHPLPTAAFRHFVWEQVSGLLCLTLAGLIWTRSALKRLTKSTPSNSALPPSAIRAQNF
jgi:hypothetical protein